jgi:putative OPT family oligopeptide transporter
MAEPTDIQDKASVDSSTAVTTAPSNGQAPAEPEHKPYVADVTKMPEFTWRAVIVGAVLGIVFGASSLYLVLKVGLTVSASIPVAVLSITLFRLFTSVFRIRKATILENNIVQTTGSAGESIAFGVGVTMPALMLLGFEMTIGRVMVVSILGGLLGILMMIPLRRAFIVKQHGKLKYPEGTACADVLIAGEEGGATAKTVFIGFGIAFIYEFAREGLKLFQEIPAKSLSWFKGATPAIEVNPALLGVGYIIGPRIASVMVAGGVLASFVLIPAIRLFGDNLDQPLYPATKLIKDMSEEEVWHEYILYIGAGAVAAGGIISLFQALPLILGSIRSGIRDIASAGAANGANGKRTDLDIHLRWVGLGSLLLVAAIWATTPLHEAVPWIPDLHMHVVGAILIVLFGFLFVTVSSRLTGEIGSSSNPISGMTVATLLLTCLIFVLLGWTDAKDRLTALSVAAVVCIAASNGGTTSQDLKTGYLVGATPKWQQYAILVGALTSALIIGGILIQLNQAYTIYTSKDLPTPQVPITWNEPPETAQAPNDDATYRVWRAVEGNEQKVKPGKYLVDDKGQIRYLVDPGINGQRSQRDDGTEVPRFKAPKATLMALITDGILRGKLPWPLVLLGVSIAVVLELCGVPSLAFAVGVYLPLSSSTPIFVGGMVRYLADRPWRKRTEEEKKRAELESETSPGSLLSTGYIAGGAIAGVLVAFLSFSDTIPQVLATWQYSTVETGRGPQDLTDAAKEAARRELGIKGSPNEEQAKEIDALSDDILDLNADLKPRFLPVPAGTVLKLPREQAYQVAEDTTLGAVAKEQLGSAAKAPILLNLNLDELIRVPEGAVLKVPGKKEPDPATVAALVARTGDDSALGPLLTGAALYPGSMYLGTGERLFVMPSEGSLADAARLALTSPEAKYQEALGGLAVGPGMLFTSTDVTSRSQELYKLNKDLEPPTILPPGTPVKLPQKTWPALVAFGLLIVLLALVGLSLLFRAPEKQRGTPAPN